MDIKIFTNTSMCPYCFGTGKLKIMQSAAVYNSNSIRVADKKVKCKHCEGTGLKIK